MRKFVVAVMVFFFTVALCTPVLAASAVSSDGYYKGIRLGGRVKVVSNFADIKVKIVDSFPDLKVKIVHSFPDDVGEWQFVEYGEDFTVQFVDSFPDIKIKYVDVFPGVN